MGKDKKKDKYEKELAKLNETEEEKRARRLAKKAKKEAKRQGVPEMAGYSNDANPWGDANLGDNFVWGKKLERDKANGIKDSGSREAQKRRRAELAVELEKVKRAREVRETEKEAWEEERRLLEREREQMAYVDNEQREDRFQLEQTKLRAHIRVREGRARPIDILAESITLLEDDCAPERALDIELHEPMRVFEHMNERELTELRADIASSAELDDANSKFWGAMAHMCEHLTREAISREGGGASGLHTEVQSDVSDMLCSKTREQLDQLHDQITERLGGGEAVDSDYWESVLAQLRVTRARATLDAVYNQLRQRRRELCGGPAQVREPEPEPGEDEEVAAATSAAGGGAAASSSGRFSPELLPEEEVDFGSDDEVAEAGAAASTAVEESDEPGRYSPVLLTAQQVNRDDAVDENEDYRQLQALRARVKSRAMDVNAPKEDGDNQLVMAESGKGMEQGEARFSFEVPLDQKVAWWHDKYRPRKPKYFNRVHTGYEWNKYNQTHYDHDNPPPKMVQGYKFNVFYPDLIDRTQVGMGVGPLICSPVCTMQSPCARAFRHTHEVFSSTHQAPGSQMAVNKQSTSSQQQTHLIPSFTACTWSTLLHISSQP